MHIATKTLEAIEIALQKDQGATYRGHLGRLMPLAGDAYSQDNRPWRPHLGASLIGRECARELWYGFHWSTLETFSGRMLRLFNRGHLEEPRFIALLLTIGCEVWQSTPDGKQFKIKGYRGHFSGSLDGVVRGLPDLPAGTPALAEFKTHGEKSFTKLVSDGVMAAKWEHFVQMQMYMGFYSLTYGIYLATCKNTDELHAEIIQFDPAIFKRYNERAVTVVDCMDPPPKIASSPGFFKCKFCKHSTICHLKADPVKNCRTCEHSRAGDAGTWYCTEQNAAILSDIVPLAIETQYVGCPKYEKKSVYEL